MRWAGATWCDVCQDGRIVAVVGSELHVRGLDGQTGVVAYVPEPLGWLRAEVTVRGALACVAQGQSGAGWLWRLGSWSNLGQTYGVSPLEVVANGTGWFLWMQTEDDRYAFIEVPLDDATLWTSYVMPPTSQGFLDATDEELLFTDKARVVGGLMLPNLAGRYLVGQDPHAERLLLGDMAGTPLRVLAEGLCFEPRGAWVNGEVVACSRSDARGALVVRGRPEDFPVWQPPAVTPPAPPTPPPNGGVTMWTEQHAALLRRFANTFLCPGGPGQDEAARAWTRKVAEQFAFSFPREGWGHKSAGSGRPPSTDVIATRSPFEGYDLILSQGRADWSIDYQPRPIPLPGQVFIEVAPTNHLGVPVEQPVPPQPPVSDLDARVAKIEDWLRSLGRVTTTGWPW